MVIKLGRRLSIISVVASLAVTTAACGGESPSSDGDDASSPLNITLITQVTGPASFYGKQVQSGVQFAVDQINAGGGVNGAQIELEVVDDASNAGQAASAATKAASGDADAVIFGVLSNNASSIAPILQKAGLPVVNVQSAAPGLLDVGDVVWKISQSAADHFDQVLRYEAAENGVKTVAIHYATDNVATKEQAEKILPPLIQQAGMTLLDSVQGKSTDSDLSTYTTRLMSKQPDLVFSLASSSAQASTLIQELRRLGYTGSYAGGTALIGGTLAAAGPAADNTVYPSSFVASDQLPWKSGAEFAAAYQTKTGTLPNSFVAESYDAVKFVEEAVKASGAATRQGVKDGLAKVAAQGFDGATGSPITFDGRQAQTPGVVVVWKDGKEQLAAAVGS